MTTLAQVLGTCRHITYRVVTTFCVLQPLAELCYFQGFRLGRSVQPSISSKQKGRWGDMDRGSNPLTVVAPNPV